MTASASLKSIEDEEQVEIAPKERRCLKCEKSFTSHWFGERICKQCKHSNSWRAGLK